jgi:hypothetical protein
MTDPAPLHDRISAPHELVVAMPHAPYVVRELQRLGVSAAEQDSSQDLGLALLGLPRDQVELAVQNTPNPSEGAGVPLDRLLRRLYAAFGADYGGWVPTMGKNRVLERVGAAHNIGGGGEAAPTPAAGLPPREADPGARVRVGVADSALWEHPWLAGAYRVAPSALRHDDGGTPDRAAGHATFVTGLVLQQAPGATVEVRRVLDDDGHADSWDVAKELVRFSRSGVDVLNLSFGCLTDDNRPPLVLATALDRLDPQLVVVAAAGNHRTAGAEPLVRPMWPAAFEEVLAVGALTPDGELADWSPDPLRLPWVDVVAPGVGLRSAYLSGKVRLDDTGQTLGEFVHGFATWSGTSFAAARVSGAIAARTVPGRVDAATVLRGMLEHPTRWWRGTVPWLA